MDILIFALGTSPAKSSKDGLGKVGSPIEIGGATLSPGTWVYGDAGATLADMNPRLPCRHAITYTPDNEAFSGH